MTRHHVEEVTDFHAASYLDRAVADGWTVFTVSARTSGRVLVVLTREEE